MSRLPLGFRAEVSYVCPTWIECRAGNQMWQAIPEEINACHGPFYCSCDEQCSVRITTVEAIAALRAADQRVFKGES